MLDIFLIFLTLWFFLGASGENNSPAYYITHQLEQTNNCE